MTLNQAFENSDFIEALNTYNFSKAFSFLDYMDAYEEREKLFLLIQEEGLNPLSGFTEIPYGFLSWGKRIKHIEIPDSVTSIGKDAFYECSSLTEIVIPDSVTSIGEDAFSDCSSLTSVVIPDNVISIGNHTFYYCSSLTSVEIPDSVTSIGDWAFYYCRSLTSVEIGDSVTSISDRAFADCSSLTRVVMPNSVTTIDYGAFSGCDNLKEIKFKGTRKEATQSGLGYQNRKKWRDGSAIERIICSDGVIEL